MSEGRPLLMMSKSTFFYAEASRINLYNEASFGNGLRWQARSPTISSGQTFKAPKILVGAFESVKGRRADEQQDGYIGTWSVPNRSILTRSLSGFDAPHTIGSNQPRRMLFFSFSWPGNRIDSPDRRGLKAHAWRSREGERGVPLFLPTAERITQVEKTTRGGPVEGSSMIQ